jgi:hypothetical protein
MTQYPLRAQVIRFPEIFDLLNGLGSQLPWMMLRHRQQTYSFTHRTLTWGRRASDTILRHTRFGPHAPEPISCND